MRPRIGWQIDAGVNGQALGNNMLAHLDDWQRREGRIAASTLWRPACSFMADTAEVLLGFVERQVPGVMHVDSNAHEAHTFDRIVAALKQEFDREAWVIEPHEKYRHDQRLIGWVAMLGLSGRLAALR